MISFHAVPTFDLSRRTINIHTPRVEVILWLGVVCMLHMKSMTSLVSVLRAWNQALLTVFLKKQCFFVDVIFKKVNLTRAMYSPCPLAIMLVLFKLKEELLMFSCSGRWTYIEILGSCKKIFNICYKKNCVQPNPKAVCHWHEVFLALGLLRASFPQPQRTSKSFHHVFWFLPFTTGLHDLWLTKTDTLASTRHQSLNILIWYLFSIWYF